MAKNAQAGMGIPRTYTEAKKRGYGAAGISFADLSDEHKANFVQFAGGASGTICGVAPSPDPSYWLVCYKDGKGQCNWVHVPRAAPVQDHS